MLWFALPVLLTKKSVTYQEQHTAKSPSCTLRRVSLTHWEESLLHTRYKPTHSEVCPLDGSRHDSPHTNVTLNSGNSHSHYKHSHTNQEHSHTHTLQALSHTPETLSHPLDALCSQEWASNTQEWICNTEEWTCNTPQERSALIQTSLTYTNSAPIPRTPRQVHSHTHQDSFILIHIKSAALL